MFSFISGPPLLLFFYLNRRFAQNLTVIYGLLPLDDGGSGSIFYIHITILVFYRNLVKVYHVEGLQCENRRIIWCHCLSGTMKRLTCLSSEHGSCLGGCRGRVG